MLLPICRAPSCCFLNRKEPAAWKLAEAGIQTEVEAPAWGLRLSFVAEAALEGQRDLPEKYLELAVVLVFDFDYPYFYKGNAELVALFKEPAAPLTATIRFLTDFLYVSSPEITALMSSLKVLT